MPAAPALLAPLLLPSPWSRTRRPLGTLGTLASPLSLFEEEEEFIVMVAMVGGAK
jgi:hypothetical protein